MAGHNKWSKIKHRKAVVDKRRGKVWTKVAKAIMVAARHGGPDPAFNLTLRYAIDEARYANMPRDVIERAIKKGAGGEDTSSFEPIRYEGYGPGGVAIIIDALTDNRTRTINDIRTAFSRCGGNVGASGCVAFMFQHLGRLALAAPARSDEEVIDAAISAGAQDIEGPDPTDDGPVWTLTTAPPAFLSVKDALASKGFTILDAELAMFPENPVAVAPEHAASLAELLETLEDLDDVQKVYTNANTADPSATDA